MSGIELEDYASRREMSNQHLVKARSSPRQTWMVSGKLVATDNFAASPCLHYMITEDHLKPANWWLAKNFDSLTGLWRDFEMAVGSGRSTLGSETEKS